MRSGVFGARVLEKLQHRYCCSAADDRFIVRRGILEPNIPGVRSCEGFRMPAADGGRGKHGRPASENLQWRKSREGIRRQRGVRYRELSGGLNCKLGAGLFSNDVGLEWVYNFGVMARVLLNGDLRFRPTCDFNELRVAKIARSTTSA